MTSLINQLVRKTTPSLRIVALSLKCPELCDPLRAVSLHSVSSDLTNNSIPLWDSTSAVNNSIAHNPKPLRLYYPGFPYGHFLNPISSAGSDQLNAGGADVTEYGTDNARTLWADSVKKKRKKKMNKHKYKKLRKRLRRKA